MPMLERDRYEVFVELFSQSRLQIYRYILTLVPNSADADELFQQTSLTLWKTWDRFDSEREFLPWAFGVARNEIRNFVRRQMPVQLLSDDVADSLTALRLQEEQLFAERQQALHACLEQLSPLQRTLVQECYGNEQSLKEVAARRGQSAESVYKAVQRIRRALFECITRKLTPGNPA